MMLMALHPVYCPVTSHVLLLVTPLTLTLMALHPIYSTGQQHPMLLPTTVEHQVSAQRLVSWMP